MKPSSLFSAIVLASLGHPAARAFVIIGEHGTTRSRTVSTPALLAASRSLSDCFAANEFSRLLDPERVLRLGSVASSSRNRREYGMTLEASEEECRALAKRFDLPALGPLRADAVLRPAPVSSGVEVEGSIFATLTQRCVRTNEDFSVNVEFPLYAIVRPVVPFGLGVPAHPSDGDEESDEDLYATMNDDHNKQAPHRSRNQPNLGNLDVFQLQQLLQDGDQDDELADVLMEDQAIWNTGVDQMDLGELVAQLFWLQLDPYPKKPGSEPVRRSISG